MPAVAVPSPGTPKNRFNVKRQKIGSRKSHVDKQRFGCLHHGDHLSGRCSLACLETRLSRRRTRSPTKARAVEDDEDAATEMKSRVMFTDFLGGFRVRSALRDWFCFISLVGQSARQTDGIRECKEAVSAI